MKNGNPASDPLTQLAQQPVAMERMTELHLVMGSQCNVRCAFCYQKSYSPKDDLSPDIVKDLLPKLRGVKNLIVQGGEPTVMKSCKMIRDHIAEAGFEGRICFLTNGVLFKDEWIDFMLSQKGAIHFSINASCKEVYDRTVRYGDFDAVMTNLKRILDLKKERGQKEPFLDLSFVIYKDNMWDILDFFEMVHSLGLPHCTFYLDCRYPATKLFEDMSEEEFDRYHELVLKTLDSMAACRMPPTEITALDFVMRTMKEEREEKMQEAKVA